MMKPYPAKRSGKPLGKTKNTPKGGKKVKVTTRKGNKI